MPIFYPNIDLENPDASFVVQNDGELTVLKALDKGLDDQWRVFHGFTWRKIIPKQGEQIGEIDVIAFHPQWGILVIEIKGGDIRCESGKWYQKSDRDGREHEMKMSPLDQARRNRYYLEGKLKGTTLGQNFAEQTALTHAAWFPDIPCFSGTVPPEVPNSAYILDSRHLDDPEKQFRNILQQTNPHAMRWDQQQIDILIRTLSPDINLIVPLGVKLGRLKDKVYRMTLEQVRAFRMLRIQKRLLVEGCAGSGKTLLAAAIAREHLQTGKRVLFTCYNKMLAETITRDFDGTLNIDVFNFHELVNTLCRECGIEFKVPDNPEDRKSFFTRDCAELLLECSEKTGRKYDTIIVDEAFDFLQDWWASLETLGKAGFSYYAFYDRNQAVFTDGSGWKPPFESDPVMLDTNVRNTLPVGTFAARLGGVSSSTEYGVKEGPEPKMIPYRSVSDIADILGKLIADITGKNKVNPDDIVVLSPYKIDHERLGLRQYILNNEKLYSMSLSQSNQRRVRLGTIQAFKGLEADVVILCGIDGHLPACSPANLYVGATRARFMLYIIHQADHQPLH